MKTSMKHSEHIALRLTHRERRKLETVAFRRRLRPSALAREIVVAALERRNAS